MCDLTNPIFTDEDKAREFLEALRAALPGQERPWILLTPGGDPIAYIDVHAMLDDQRWPRAVRQV